MISLIKIYSLPLSLISVIAVFLLLKKYFANNFSKLVEDVIEDKQSFFQKITDFVDKNNEQDKAKNKSQSKSKNKVLEVEVVEGIGRVSGINKEAVVGKNTQDLANKFARSMEGLDPKTVKEVGVNVAMQEKRERQRQQGTASGYGRGM